MSELQITKTDKKPATLKDWLASDHFKQQVAAVLPSVCTPERFVRTALTALLKTPKLTQCTQESVFECMLNCAQWGLEPDGRRAHLIPYGNKCTLIIDFKGLVELAMRSGTVSGIHADVVCENDQFDYDRGQVVTHKIDLRKPRGDMFAAYCIVRFKDSTEKCEVMNKQEIDSIRNRSRAGTSGPWVTDYNEMAKKTVFRRASKWIQLSPEFRDAVDSDDDVIATPKAQIKSPAFLIREPEAETVVVVDEPPMGEPESVQEALWEFLVGAGVSFDDFRDWLGTTSRVKDAGALSCMADVPADICHALKADTKTLTGLVKLYGNKAA